MREERIREEKGMGHWECRKGEGDSGVTNYTP